MDKPEQCTKLCLHHLEISKVLHLISSWCQLPLAQEEGVLKPTSFLPSLMFSWLAANSSQLPNLPKPGGVELKHLIFSSTSFSLAPSEMTSPLNWDIISERKQEAQCRCGAAPVTAHPCAVSPLPRSANHRPQPCVDTCDLPASFHP